MTPIGRSAACVAAFFVAIAATFAVTTLGIEHEALVQVLVFELSAVATTWWLAGRRNAIVALLLAAGGCLVSIGVLQVLLDDGRSLGTLETIIAVPAVLLVLAPWYVAFLATPLPRDRS